ncbi:uncharacterized protein LOC106640143 [Copidosoma floridanum]|uniref:uncharacterized protein LOC106640143 n=1 Tax=Copidosoma floridanum TaxID=29053 RepID=UPI0006C9884B|nr:uncharacterized protein LOC106640143 [Copidosoma floridanum]
MSALLVARDSQILMLEVQVEKLFVPHSSPFDSVILSKFIVSFRFLDDEWTDVAPNRLDYKNYRGSSGEEQAFHGGKSTVFSVPESMLAAAQEGLELEVRVRREISRYFETRGHGHVIEVGRALVGVDDLFNGIVKELKTRCDLGDYLRLAHERDPISRSLKDRFELEEGQPGTEVELYVRLSHLGGCVVTEIDRPSRGELLHFYAQEEGNLSKPYECLELKAEQSPDLKIPALTALKAHPSLQLECACTDEQKYQVRLSECSRTCGTGTDGDDNKAKPEEAKKKKRTKDKGSNTDAGTADKSVGTPSQIVKDGSEKKKASGPRKKRRGSGPMVYIEKSEPCPIPEPCCPVIVCELPCADPCLPPVCCYE